MTGMLVLLSRISKSCYNYHIFHLFISTHSTGYLFFCHEKSCIIFQPFSYIIKNKNLRKQIQEVIMSSKTKIVVLHMKEIIYTVLFICLGILLVALLTFMFHPKNKETSSSKSTSYQPGIYTSQLTLGDKELEVEVTIDENHINSIRFSNLDDTVTTMYPLIQPTMEEIADQICQTQSLENISYSSDNPYTSQIIINAIDDALKKAVTTR